MLKKLEKIDFLKFYYIKIHIMEFYPKIPILEFYLDENIMSSLIEYLKLNDILKMRRINKGYYNISKLYTGSYNNMISIRKNFSRWKEIFPNIAFINISRNTKITDNDFKLFDKVIKLDMALCTQKEITDFAFVNCHNLLELNLQGACRHWIGAHHFTDEIFESLKKLKKLYIDDNHEITDAGLSLLCDIEDLHLSNCSKITNNGFKNAGNLVKLEIYNIPNLTDNVFDFTPNIKILSITFAHNITDNGILKLEQIKTLSLTGSNKIKGLSYDTLLELKELRLNYISIPSINHQFLRNISKITFYSCNMDGSELQYLTNTKNIAIYECVNFHNIDYLYDKDKVCIFRCNLITKGKKDALKLNLGDKLLCD